MKKNTFMRLAMALVLLVLVTTSAVGGTFAKYVTSKDVTETARVAKWGLGTSEVVIDLFSDTYDDTVDSNDGAEVVAPGTTKSTTIYLDGKDTIAPEVDYELTFKIEDAGSYAALFNKLEWSLNGGEFGTFGQLQSDLTAIIKTVNANTQPDAQTITIAWQWPFAGDDASDTVLGNDGTFEVLVKLTITATQVD